VEQGSADPVPPRRTGPARAALTSV
jgi:hypothetical protein